jgi:colanic acid/amylovoran biosynthesis protein
MNRGDLSILTATISSLRSVFKKARFIALSIHPELDSSIVSECVFLPKLMTAISLFKNILVLVSLLIMSLFWPITSSFIPKLARYLAYGLKHATLQAYISSDFVVVRGSDTLSDVYGFSSFLSNIVDIIVAILLKKKIAVLGHTIGPFNNRFTELICIKTLSKVKLVTVRERKSFEYLLEIGVDPSKIFLTADIAFLLAKNYMYEKTEEKQAFYKISLSPVVGSFTNLVNHLIRKHHAKIILLPHVFGPGNNDDRISLRELTRFCIDIHSVELIEDELSLKDIRRILKKCDVFVSCRMHALIAALCALIPSIGIDYNFKTICVMEEAGLGEWTLSEKNLNSKLLIEMVESLLNKKSDIKKRIMNKIPKLIERAELNGVITRKLM